MAPKGAIFFEIYISIGETMQEAELNKIIVELVKQFAKPVYIGAKALGTQAVDKLKVNLNTCFTKYLERCHERYSSTKTLLYREVPVNLKDFYVRTDLSLGQGSLIKESAFINEIEEKQKIIVSGTAGSGKSTFCKSIFLDLIESPRGIFPIFIELRHLNSQKDGTLYDYVTDTLTNIESTFSKQQLEYSLKLGKVLLIFDGFDEINSDIREKYEKEIIELANKYQKIMILVSSRPDGRFSSWEEFYHYNILPLDKEKAKNLILKLEYDRQVKRQFLQELEKSLYDKHQSFARNPLLLTMMLLTYEQIAEIPNKIHLFYEQAFLTLFNKHDSLKSLYKRKSFSGLPLDDFKKVLSSFCVLSYADKKYFFNQDEILNYLEKAIHICGVVAEPKHFLNDLLDSVCIMQRDGLGFTFTHRSFQEYFTALFLVGLANRNRFEVFDKIAFVNDRDDVIPMIFDINSDLLEQEWIIPRLEKMVFDFSTIPSTNEGKIMVIAKMYKGLTIHHGDDEFTVAFRLHSDTSDHTHFLFILFKIYHEEIQSYQDKYINEQTPAQLNVEKNLIRLDIRNHHDDFLDLSDLSRIKKATKNRIIKSGCCDHFVCRLDFIKHKLESLKRKHSEKHKDISQLLLGED